MGIEPHTFDLESNTLSTGLQCPNRLFKHRVGGSLTVTVALKPLWSGMAEGVPAHTSPIPHPPIPSHYAVTWSTVSGSLLLADQLIKGMKGVDKGLWSPHTDMAWSILGTTGMQWGYLGQVIVLECKNRNFCLPYTLQPLDVNHSLSPRPYINYFTDIN